MYVGIFTRKSSELNFQKVVESDANTTRILQVEFSIANPFYIICLSEQKKGKFLTTYNLNLRGMPEEQRYELAYNGKAVNDIVLFTQSCADSALQSPLDMFQLTLMTKSGSLYQLWPFVHQTLFM